MHRLHLFVAHLRVRPAITLLYLLFSVLILSISSLSLFLKKIILFLNVYVLHFFFNCAFLKEKGDGAF